mgnify:CR=1 FL=1
MERENFGLRSVRGPVIGRGGIKMPVSFDTGVQNRPLTHIFGELPAPLDPSLWSTYFDDFHTFTAALWTATETGAAGTITNPDGSGGLLLLTTDALDNDNEFLQKIQEGFLFTAGKPLIFGARFKVAKATQSDFVIGLQITDTSPLAVSDGIYFQKDDGDALLDFHVTKDAASTDATGIHTVVADTYLTVEFAYDGGARIYYGVNGVVKGFTVITNAPDDEALTISLGFQNGEAGATTMECDYVLASQYRG